MNKMYNRMVICGMGIGDINIDLDVKSDSKSGNADQPREKRERNGEKKVLLQDLQEINLPYGSKLSEQPSQEGFKSFYDFKELRRS